MRRPHKILVALTASMVLAATLSSSPASSASSDLAGYWPLDEGGGQTAHDHSFSGNHGQLGSSAGADAQDPSWITLSQFLLFRTAALRFDGTQRVRVANAPSLEPDGVTIVARVRSTQSAPFRYIASKGALSCAWASYGLYTGASGGLQFYVSDGTSSTLSADAGAQVWDGQWHTISGAYDGGVVRLFVDGEEVGSPVAATVTPTYGLPDGQDFFLGDYVGACPSSLGFAGDIDSVKLVGHYDQDSLLGSLLGP